MDILVSNTGKNKRQIGVAPTQVAPAAVLRSVFQSISPSSCPHEANFHMHTVHSDGNLTPKELVHQAIRIGLRDFAITDHHSIGGYLQAKQCMDHHRSHNDFASEHQSRDGLPRLWVGAEVNALLLDAEVHVLCYAFNPAAEVMQPYLQGESVTGDRYLASSVIDAIHEAGGLAVLAHPDRYRRSPTDLIPEAARLGMDGIETYYAYDNPSPWRPSPKQTALVRQLGEAYNLLHTCGTDTHGMDMLKRL
jgi:predicted metal-dependent phosphoesterase TrpH